MYNYLIILIIITRLDYRVGKQGWDAALSEYIKNLQKTKPVLLVGDMNCAHQVGLSECVCVCVCVCVCMRASARTNLPGSSKN